MPPPNFFVISKMNGTQRGTLISEMYCVLPKSTSETEMISNSEKVKLLQLIKGISQLSDNSVTYEIFIILEYLNQNA